MLNRVLAAERALGILFPARCPFCRAWIDPGTIMCGKCWERLPEEPYLRKLELDDGTALFTMAPLAYEDVFRDALIRYKFRHKPWMARPIGRVMAELLPLYPQRFDAIVFSPTSMLHVIQRGFDQSRLLAEEIGRRSKLPVIHALRRRHHRTQHELGRSERKANVAGAYRCIEDVEGKAILLVDDIITTGSTMAASAQALYEAGASRVYGICAADAGE